MPANSTIEISSVYGPVDSWRLGKSLGIDLIMSPSTCSFNCTYCQLGFIQKITTERRIFVPTEKVIKDFLASNWKVADVITISGSGEPTLAKNIGEVIREIKKITTTPIAILTNATLLNDPEVRSDVIEADILSVKLDAPDDETLQAINRPASGINLETILSGIKKLKDDIKSLNPNSSILTPKLQIQIMFMPQNKNKTKELATLLSEIKPNEVALNTPTRPYPSGFDIITRGAHGEDAKKIQFSTKPLKQLTLEEAKEIEENLKKLTGLNVISVYE
ncbi:MAG: radical SAM protein [Candidatus Melainabacteria bacterium]|nr:radical SAM protein [Candidatus Melainabacteria bacterium]